MTTNNINEELLTILINEVKTLRVEVAEHKTEEDKVIKELKEKVDELTSIWKATKTIVWFVKWSAAIIGSIAIAWAFLHNHFHIGIK